MAMPEPLPPAVTVAGAADARVAAAAAAGTGRAVTLLSIAGGAHSWGIGGFQALVARAQHQAPGAQIVAALDCGDDPATAFEAMRAGVPAIVVAAPEALRMRIAAAVQPAPYVLAERPRAIGPGADAAAIEAWLGGQPGGP